MSSRLTDGDKWKDIWFSNLSPYAKLLFIFLCENCNNAGIYEVNKKFLLFYLGISEEQLSEAIKEIQKSYVKSHDGKRIWLKNFLKYQKKLPLNPNNNNHKQIIMILTENLLDANKFKGNKEMQSVLPSVPKVSKKPVEVVISNEVNGSLLPAIIESAKKPATERFIKPSVDEILEYMKSKNFFAYQVESERFYNYFESNGWKVGKNAMKNWKYAINTWIFNFKERNKLNSNKSKIENIKESHEQLDGVDWDTIYGAS